MNGDAVSDMMALATIGWAKPTGRTGRGDYSVVLRFLVLQPVVLRPVDLCTTSPTPCFLPHSVVLRPNSPTLTSPTTTSPLF